MTSFGNQVLRGVSQNYTSDLLKKYQAVTVQDVIKALRIHFLPLFDPERSIAAVVTGPAKAIDVTHGLESVGFDVEQREISSDAWLGDTEDSEGELSDGSDTS
jgi:hypothetical protein